MNIKETLAPRAAQSRQALGHVTLAVKAKALTMPRIMEKTSKDKLNDDFRKCIVNVGISIYKIATNKTPDYRLQSRELNKLGRVTAIVALTTNIAVIPVMVHEKWVRSQATPSLSEDLMKNLMKAAEAAANRGSTSRQATNEAREDREAN